MSAYDGRWWKEIALVLRDAVFEETEPEEQRIDVIDLKVQ